MAQRSGAQPHGRTPPTPRPQGPPGPVPPRGAPAVPTSFVPRSEFRPAAPTCGSAGTGAAKSPFRERSSALECREPRDGHQNRHRRRRGREGGSAAGRGPVASHPFRFSFFFSAAQISFCSSQQSPLSISAGPDKRVGALGHRAEGFPFLSQPLKRRDVKPKGNPALQKRSANVPDTLKCAFIYGVT